VSERTSKLIETKVIETHSMSRFTMAQYKNQPELWVFKRSQIQREQRSQQREQRSQQREQREHRSQQREQRE
jgi:hypothetical protein